MELAKNGAWASLTLAVLVWHRAVASCSAVEPLVQHPPLIGGIDLLKVSEVLATVASVLAVGRNHKYKCGLDLLCMKNGLRSLCRGNTQKEFFCFLLSTLYFCLRSAIQINK